MTTSTVSYTLHGGLHSEHGFIVPKGVIIKIYGIPGLIMVKDKFTTCNQNSDDVITFHEGDFIYDLSFEPYPTSYILDYDRSKGKESETLDRLNSIESGIFLEKHPYKVKKDASVQERLFMFKDYTDEQIKELEEDGKYIFGKNYTLSKLCYDLKYEFLKNSEKIIIHSVSCLGISDLYMCESIKTNFLKLNDLGAKYKAHVYNTYDILNIVKTDLLYYYEIYDVKSDEYKNNKVLNEIDKNKPIYGNIHFNKLYTIKYISIYVSKSDNLNDITAIDRFNSIIELLKQDVEFTKNVSFTEDRILDKVIISFKTSVTGEDLRDLGKIYQRKIKEDDGTVMSLKDDFKRKSIRDTNDYNIHSGNKLIKHITDFYNYVKNFNDKYKCTKNFIEGIIYYYDKEDVVVIPYLFLCVILDMVPCKDKQYLVCLNTGDSVMCSINEFDKVYNLYLNEVHPVEHRILASKYRIEYYKESIRINDIQINSINSQLNDHYKDPENSELNEKGINRRLRNLIRFKKENSNYNTKLLEEDEKMKKCQTLYETIDSNYSKKINSLTKKLNKSLNRFKLISEL